MKRKKVIQDRIKEVRGTPDLMRRSVQGQLYEDGYKNGYIKALEWVLSRSCE